MFFKKKEQAQPSFVKVVAAHLALDEQIAQRIKPESIKLIRDLVNQGTSPAKIGKAIGRPKSYVASIYNGSRYLTPRQFMAVVQFAARGAK